MKKVIIAIVLIIALPLLVLIGNYVIVEKKSSRISVGEPIIRKETKRQALLVIDIQEGITGKYSTNDYYISHSGELISNVNRIADSSALNNIPVIYIRSEISNFLINILNNSLAKGSPGAELDSRLNRVSDYVVVKDIGDAFSNPRLDSILIQNEINKLHFAGLDMAHCVNSTILGAVNRQYEISVISDALLSKSELQENVMIDSFQNCGYEIITSEEYLEGLHEIH